MRAGVREAENAVEQTSGAVYSVSEYIKEIRELFGEFLFTRSKYILFYENGKEAVKSKTDY